MGEARCPDTYGETYLFGSDPSALEQYFESQDRQKAAQAHEFLSMALLSVVKTYDRDRFADVADGIAGLMLNMPFAEVKA